MINEALNLSVICSAGQRFVKTSNDKRIKYSDRNPKTVLLMLIFEQDFEDKIIDHYDFEGVEGLYLKVLHRNVSKSTEEYYKLLGYFDYSGLFESLLQNKSKHLIRSDGWYARKSLLFPKIDKVISSLDPAIWHR